MHSKPTSGISLEPSWSRLFTSLAMYSPSSGLEGLKAMISSVKVWSLDNFAPETPGFIFYIVQYQLSCIWPVRETIDFWFLRFLIALDRIFLKHFPACPGFCPLQASGKLNYQQQYKMQEMETFAHPDFCHHLGCHYVPELQLFLNHVVSHKLSWDLLIGPVWAWHFATL